VAKRIFYFNIIYHTCRDFCIWLQNADHFGHSVVFYSILVQIENELRGICSDVLEVLKDHLLPVATQAEAKVFYSKMYVPLALYSSFL